MGYLRVRSVLHIFIPSVYEPLLLCKLHNSELPLLTGPKLGKVVEAGPGVS